MKRLPCLWQNVQNRFAFYDRVDKKPEAEIIEELSGVIFKSIDREWETSDEYLSGNVRIKLEVAKQFAESQDRYQVNVQALEKCSQKNWKHQKLKSDLVQRGWTQSISPSLWENYFRHQTIILEAGLR